MVVLRRLPHGSKSIHPDGDKARIFVAFDGTTAANVVPLHAIERV